MTLIYFIFYVEFVGAIVLKRNYHVVHSPFRLPEACLDVRQIGAQYCCNSKLSQLTSQLLVSRACCCVALECFTQNHDTI